MKPSLQSTFAILLLTFTFEVTAQVTTLDFTNAANFKKSGATLQYVGPYSNGNPVQSQYFVVAGTGYKCVPPKPPNFDNCKGIDNQLGANFAGFETMAGATIYDVAIDLAYSPVGLVVDIGYSLQSEGSCTIPGLIPLGNGVFFNNDMPLGTSFQIQCTAAILSMDIGIPVQNEILKYVKFSLTPGTPLPPAPPAPPYMSSGTQQSPVTNSCNEAGSIIQADNQVVGEKIPITGTPFSLYYYSDRVPGRIDNYRYAVPTPGTSLPNGVTQVQISATYLSRNFQQTFPAPGGSFIWDGLDSSGNIVESTAPVAMVVSYTSDGGTSTTDFPINLGSWNPLVLGLGGWTLSVHHFLDVNTQRLYLGSGTSRLVAPLNYQKQYLATNVDGSEAYIFDKSGHHLQTLNGLTGDLIYTFGYDAQWHLNTVTDAFNNVTVISNPNGIPSAITSPYGQVTALALGPQGYLGTVTDPNNESYQMTYYDSRGLLETFQKPSGHLSTLTYDSNGFLQEDAGNGGNFLAYIRNILASGWQIQQTTALTRQTNFQISSDGLNSTRAVQDPAGFITQTVDNPQGTSSSSEPNGFMNSFMNATDFRYGYMAPYPVSTIRQISGTPLNLTLTENKSGSLTNPNNPFSVSSLSITQVVQGKNTFSSIYTGKSRTTTYKSAVGRTATTILNSKGLLASTQIASLNPVLINYDSNGRLYTVQQGTRLTTFNYNPLGQLAKITDPLSRVTYLGYDPAGRVTSVERPDLKTVGYGYDSDGNLSSVTPAGQPQHQFPVNDFDLIGSYMPPSLPTVPNVNTLYFYNNDEQLTSVQRPDGPNIVYNYDPITGRLGTINAPDGNYVYSYSPSTGQLSQIISPDNVTLALGYVGPLPGSNSETVDGATTQVTNTYNPDFTLATITAQGSDGVTAAVTYKYDADEIPNAAGAEKITYDPKSALLTATTLGKVSEKRTNDAYGALASDLYKVGSKTLYSLTISPPNNAGQITQKTETIGSTTNVYVYGYDSIGRLYTVTLNGNLISTYNLDANGNRTSFTANGQTVTGVPDAQDRLVSYGSTTYSYNAYGDLMSKTNGALTTSYSYDVFGNLKSVGLPNGTTVSYLVDGLGRRVVKEINGVASQQFLYQSQLQLAAVLDPTGHIVSEFVYGTKANVPDYMVQGGVTYRIISDNLGSPKVVVNSATGAVVETISYDEFGNVLSDSNPGFIPFGFAGGIYDRDTGLLRFGARDYDPSIGRWLAKDPLLFGGGDTNLYGYVANDPVNWTDPSGKCPLCVAAGIGAAVGAAANLTGSYIAGTLTFTNAGQTALVGALAGGAAVLTSGTAALATATSLTGLVTTELGSGLVGTLAGAGIDLGLTALTSPPNPYPQTLRPQNTCP